MKSSFFSDGHPVQPPLFWSLMATMFLVCGLIQYYTLPCTDIAWLIWGTREMLSGAVLYKDILESNPPFIYWLYAVPVRAALYFGWSGLITLKFFAIGLIGISLLLCDAVLRQSSLWNGEVRRSLLLAVGGIMLFADSFMIFAQREHLLVVLFMPYALLNLPSVARQDVSLRLRQAIGLLAGVGLCIKPFFLALWLVVLLYRFFLRVPFRRIVGDAEMVIVAALACYAASVALFAPEYLDWLKIHTQIFAASGYLRQTALDKAGSFVYMACVALGVAWISGVFRLSSAVSYRKDVWYMIALTVGGFLEALLQFKTWEYIFYPFFALGMLAILMHVLKKPVHHFMGIVVVAWAMFTTTPLSDNRQDGVMDAYEDVTKTIAPYNAKNWYFFSLFFAPPPLYLESGPYWLGHVYNMQFVLTGVMQRYPESMQPSLTPQPGKEWINEWLLDNIADVLEKRNPELIAIDQKWFYGDPVNESFDFNAWLNHSKRMRRIFKHYRLRDTVSLCAAVRADTKTQCSLKIYRRL